MKDKKNIINNFEEVFRIFEENYELVPLEIFGDKPYETLISTVMSARTKDETTLTAAQRLFEKAPNVYELEKLSETQIAKLIYPVGFYKTKAKHIKRLSKILINRYSGQVPQTIKELTSLPGVGRKTANLVLNRAFGTPAIAVDTHVHKISNYLGWVKTNNPEATEKALVKLVPRKYWSDMNRLFVSIGRQYKTKDRIFTFLEDANIISVTKLAVKKRAVI